ncbi:GIY-YIG nuclease family protein [Halotalea alkalilenta]|uniref:GIY-YIG nuclease family protein n=1 Tax=Halotalea alkalilenta TaxID=376489 RepID=UPI0005BC689B|nr:GIY-YIG nuclease family protein [Halotalea alkalilenta]
MSAEKASEGWWLYVVETSEGKLYTGITTDVARRIEEHACGPRGARALRGKGPLSLRFSQAVGNRSQALRLECALKRLKRADKLQVVEGRRPLDSLL